MYSGRVRKFTNIFPLANLFAGQSISGLASVIFDMTLIWYALDLSPNIGAVGIILFFRFLPFALLGLIGGWVSDNWPRKRLLVIGEICRALIIFTGLLLLKFVGNTAVVLACLGFSLSATRAVLGPITSCIIPALCRPETIVQVNAIRHLLGEAIAVIAPLIGGALIGLLPLNGVLIIVSGLFAVATILAMCLPLYEERRPKTANPIIEYGNLIRHIKQRKDRLLSALFVNLIAIIGVTAALSLLLPALISHHYPDDPLILGIVTSMIALGTMIGSGMTMIAKRVEPYFGMYVGWLLYGVFILLIALEHNMVTLISVGAFLGLVGAPADIFMNVIIHKNVAANKMAKTFALFATIGYSGDMISVVTIGMVAGVLGLQATFILSGGIVIVAALVGLALTLSAQDLKS